MQVILSQHVLSSINVLLPLLPQRLFFPLSPLNHKPSLFKPVVCLSTNLCNQVSVLGVHLGYGSGLLTVGEGGVQLGVLQHEHVFVGHEHLKGIDALLFSERLHLFFDLEKKRVEGIALSSIDSMSTVDTPGAMSFLDLWWYFWQLIHLVAPPCDGDMQRVVAANFGISFAPPAVVGLQERLALFGDDKVQDHRCPSCQGRLGKQAHSKQECQFTD